MRFDTITGWPESSVTRDAYARQRNGRRMRSNEEMLLAGFLNPIVVWCFEAMHGSRCIDRVSSCFTVCVLFPV